MGTLLALCSHSSSHDCTSATICAVPAPVQRTVLRLLFDTSSSVVNRARTSGDPSSTQTRRSAKPAPRGLTSSIRCGVPRRRNRNVTESEDPAAGAESVTVRARDRAEEAREEVRTDEEHLHGCPRRGVR